MTPSSRLTVATAFHWISWNAATPPWWRSIRSNTSGNRSARVNATAPATVAMAAIVTARRRNLMSLGGRGADEVLGVVDAARSLVARDLWIRAERTAAIDLAGGS